MNIFNYQKKNNGAVFGFLFLCFFASSHNFLALVKLILKKVQSLSLSKENIFITQEFKLPN